MDKDFNSSIECNSSNLKESDNEQSFVGKFKSIINSTPLSKWFRRQDDGDRPTVRRREDDDEDICQPPSKKVKLPTEFRENNCELSFEVPNRPSLRNSIAVTRNTLNCFPEPVAGPSGIKHRKILVATTTNTVQSSFNASEVFNGQKDTDSEGESTSGYSSVARINSKEHVYRSQDSSKQTSPTQNSANPNNTRTLFPTANSTMNRSLFADKTTTPNMNTSLSSRRPTFNVSTFGSPNLMDKTLTTKKIINSPFYSGRTVYGGASAYGRSLGRSAQDLKMNLKNSVRIKPVNNPTESKDLVLGKTARRILETLEQYSSPVNDAKKIPVSSKRLNREGIISKYVGAHPYSKVGSNRELQVPSVSDLLKMKQKNRLQDTTETVKRIAKSSNSDLNVETYKLSTTENEKEKHTGKMRTKVTSVRQNKQADEVMSEVNLNPVALPITTLPKFDLVIPPPAAAIVSTMSVSKITEKLSSTPSANSFATDSTLSISSATPKTETEKTVLLKKQSLPVTEYRFSKPIVLSENLESIVACNNFKFSEPISKKTKVDPPSSNSSSNTLNFKMPENKLPTLVPNKSKNNGEATAKPAPTLITTGSVMDILGKKNEDSLLDKFKPTEGTWECSTCMLRNQVDKTKCAACETPKEKVEKNTELPNQFKLTTSNTWACGCCLVSNKNEDIKCVACTTPKPSTNQQAKSIGFGEKFKAPPDSWECSTCMIKNKTELSKCAACETPKNKPIESTTSNNASLGNWHCLKCAGMNKGDAVVCTACGVNKDVSKITSSFDASFSKKDDEWECDACMVRNKPANLKCQCCETAKPGSKEKEIGKNPKSVFGLDKATESFKFGIPVSASTALPTSDVNPAAVFGEQAKLVTTSVAPTFTFGIPSSAEQVKPIETSIISKSVASNPLLKPNEKLPEKAKPAPAGFTFGLASPSTAPKENVKTTASSEAQKPMFNFSPKTSALSNKPPANMFVFGAKPTATATPLTSQNTLEGKQSSVPSKFVITPENKTLQKKLPETSSTKTKLSSTPATTNLFGTGMKQTNVTFSFGNKSVETSKPLTASNIPINTASGVSVELPKTNISSGNTLNENTSSLFGVSKSAANSSIFGSSSTVTDRTIPSFGSVSKLDGTTAPVIVASTNIDNTSSLFGAGTKPIGNATPSFGSVTKPGQAVSQFSSPSIKPVETPAPLFGAKAAENTAPMFGSSANNATTVNNGFSNNSFSTFGSANSPNFGTTMMPMSTEVKPFSFKTDTAIEEPPKKAPMFSFGQSASTPMSQPTQPPTFNFGSLAPAATGGFNFAGEKTNETNFASSAFSANSSSGKNGTFNFGSATSNNTSQKVGFSFGATSNLTSTPVFNFGSNATGSTPAPSTGGFNFSTAPVKFDANAKPTFNFTDGNVTTFSAPPLPDGGSAIPGRKIKKGIRRAPR